MGNSASSLPAVHRPYPVFPTYLDIDGCFTALKLGYGASDNAYDFYTCVKLLRQHVLR